MLVHALKASAISGSISMTLSLMRLALRASICSCTQAWNWVPTHVYITLMMYYKRQGVRGKSDTRARVQGLKESQAKSLENSGC